MERLFLFLATLFLQAHLVAGDAAYSELYFAYGSNMSHEFLNERLKDGEWLPDGWHKKGMLHPPFPVDLGPSTLEGYEFGYTLKLETETAGNIVPKEGAIVYGVLYKISKEHLKLLDESEDVPRDYSRVLRPVRTTAGGVFDAWAYVGNPALYTDEIRPDPEYVDLLLKAAKARNFPANYIESYLTPTVCTPAPM